MNAWRRRLVWLAAGLVAGAGFGCASPSPTVAGDAPLPSWNDGAARQAIVDFVERVTTDTSPDFVAPAERIAVFDNDGTLWAEQPLYFQLLFAMDRVRALAPEHPEWAREQPFKALLDGDTAAALAGGEHAIVEIVMATHAGLTTAEFDAVVREWLARATHPTLKRPYTDVVYQPMLELLAYLRAHGFKTFIVSGGGVDFMRAFAERVYGIPPEQVIGSVGGHRYEVRDGAPALVKLPQIDYVDDKAGKPVAIQRAIGRRPIMAFGNSDGDFEMLEWTTAGDGPRLGLLVHHDDDAREWAYDRTSSIGRLDRGLSEAGARGWTVVSMRTDWKQVFRFE